MTAFPHGSYRRRIRLVATDPRVVEGGLEDDFHHFEVTLRHDGRHVTRVEGRARRAPWSTCAEAVHVLREMEGMTLSTSSLAARRHTDPAANCTHLLDVAGLAVAHAARMVEARDAAAVRQYDVEIPFGAQSGGEVEVRLARDGVPLLAWTLDGRRCVRPSPYSEAPWAPGFVRWAEEQLDRDTAEAAVVLRRACEIGMGRGMDLDAYARADQLRGLMLGRCHTFGPATVHLATRAYGTIRDFDADPDALLADRP